MISQDEIKEQLYAPRGIIRICDDDYCTCTSYRSKAYLNEEIVKH